MAAEAGAASTDAAAGARAAAGAAALQAQRAPPWLITSEYLDPSLPQTRKLHLIVLNWHLPAVTARLWEHAATRICADGGANRLHDQIPSLARGAAGAAAARAAFVPDLIKGDLDSVRPDVRDYYASLGVPFVDLSADQDTTDLTKCLTYLDQRIRGGGGGGGGGCAGSGGEGEGGVSEEAARRLRSEHVIVVLGALGGRLDHILAHLNTLYSFPHLDITLCGDGNLVRLLPRGASVVRPHPVLEGPTCGLVPLAAPAVATSEGLKWDLCDTEMRFRGLISTSNIIAAPEVRVATDEDLLWITEFNDDSSGHGGGGGGGGGNAGSGCGVNGNGSSPDAAGA